MCMALTRQRPSLIPLSARASSTWSVMLINSTRSLVLKTNSLRKDFIKTTPFPFSILPLSPGFHNLPRIYHLQLRNTQILSGVFYARGHQSTPLLHAHMRKNLGRPFQDAVEVGQDHPVVGYRDIMLTKEK